jgi:hypothetical protein
MKLSDDQNEAVYDIKILPPHYALPPESFEEHFRQYMGYSPQEYIAQHHATPTDPMRVIV